MRYSRRCAQRDVSRRGLPRRTIWVPLSALARADKDLRHFYSFRSAGTPCILNLATISLAIVRSTRTEFR